MAPLRHGQEPTRRDVMALALTPQHVYTATEQALLCAIRAFDRGPCTGSEWHRDVLRNMAVAMPGVRQAV